MPEACFVYLLAWKQDLAYFESRLMQGRYFAYNGWQMHWPVPGYREKRGVCLYKLISQTKRVSRPTSCFGSKQTAVGGWGGPHPPGKTRWDLSMTASITSRLTNEQFTEMTHLKGSVVLAVNLGTSQSVEGGCQRVFLKKETRGETVSSCFVFRSGSD